MPVRISIEGGPHEGVSSRSLARHALAMMRAVQMDDSELSVLLTGDIQIAILNRIYRRKDRPTDVLAFAQREGEHGEHAGAILGDVVISVETARKQARTRRVDVVTEVTMLLAHGLLHLLGWDHDTPAKDRRMRRETERLCEAARVAEPSAGRGPARDTTSTMTPRPRTTTRREQERSGRGPVVRKTMRRSATPKSR
jgi:probable rRNA maturation factor